MVIFQNADAFKTWHDRLGHPSIEMMQKIIINFIGSDLNDAKFPQSLQLVGRSNHCVWTLIISWF